MISFAEAVKNNWNKGQVAEKAGFLPTATYDVALPQEWLDAATELLCSYRYSEELEAKQDCYDFIRFNTVWLYQEGDPFGSPDYITTDMSEIAERVGL